MFAVQFGMGIHQRVFMNESKPLARGQWFVLVAAFLGWMFDGVEMGLFPLVARPALQDLLHITDDAQIAYWNSIIVACFLLGRRSAGYYSVGSAIGSAACVQWSSAS